MLILVGKGHNGGDACLATLELAKRCPGVRVDVITLGSPEHFRPLAKRAWGRLNEEVKIREIGRIDAEAPQHQEEWAKLLATRGGHSGWDISLDGLFGMSFRPPVTDPCAGLIHALNHYEAISLRAAVDIPSGYSEEHAAVALRADFTYAMGSVKISNLMENGPAGRLRYCDLGFFDRGAELTPSGKIEVIHDRVMEPLRALRSSTADKRTFGHLFVVGGSAYMPGALLMAVQSALKSGAGLVTAFAPASVAGMLAAQLPEAMWVPWPETSNGTLSPVAMPLVFERIDRATALLVGPGLGADRFTRSLCQELIQRVPVPMVLDADALYPDIIELHYRRKPEYGPVFLTPHHGEFERLTKTPVERNTLATLHEYANRHRVGVVLKGDRTFIAFKDRILCNLRGGPVLSRGGSGDILAGMIASMIAQRHLDHEHALAAAVHWHGMAAESLARDHGQVSVRTTELIDYFSKALRHAPTASHDARIGQVG